jgi:hypothetical protein
MEPLSKKSKPVKQVKQIDKIKSMSNDMIIVGYVHLTT